MKTKNFKSEKDILAKNKSRYLPSFFSEKVIGPVF